MTQPKFIHDVRKNEVHEVIGPRHPLGDEPVFWVAWDEDTIRRNACTVAVGPFYLPITYEEMVALRIAGATVFLRTEASDD